MKRKKSYFLPIAALAVVLAVVCAAAVGINTYVKHIGGKSIISPEYAGDIDDADCILILGCGVRSDGQPSDMLSDRLKRGIELYDNGVAPKIIMSGDHGRNEYDEVNTMKSIALESGVASEDVFMDHAGFSTYESLYRARDIFKAQKIIIISQEYHLHRALYIADGLGIEAYGISSDYRAYRGQGYREIREVVARCKDFFKVIVKPKPTYLGEEIPVSGNGDITND